MKALATHFKKIAMLLCITDLKCIVCVFTLTDKGIDHPIKNIAMLLCIIVYNMLCLCVFFDK
jgi:hypothetical protein